MYTRSEFLREQVTSPGTATRLWCVSLQDSYSHHHGCFLSPSCWDAKLLPDWGILSRVRHSGTRKAAISISP